MGGQIIYSKELHVATFLRLNEEASFVSRYAREQTEKRQSSDQALCDNFRNATGKLPPKCECFILLELRL
jgi:hypothetical protein